jgi:hypothetical protein
MGIVSIVVFPVLVVVGLIMIITLVGYIILRVFKTVEEFVIGLKSTSSNYYEQKCFYLPFFRRCSLW